jgi:CDP-glucose 4,6-dehydratase
MSYFKKNGIEPAFWDGKRVFITGHTGFKGSWLSIWLANMGAQVTGYALAPNTSPNLYEVLDVGGSICQSHIGDIRDIAHLRQAISDASPEVVLHMAAQPVVRYSYEHPLETYSTNVMGTVNLLECVRALNTVKAVVVVTTDKCYENREWLWPYRENEAMGGYDPYSASKGAAELVIASYRRSFFSGDGALLASVRAGNVIGGGDWATDRLIPDIIRAILTGEHVEIRSPDAVRPWQHVLEALGGYLGIAERMVAGDATMAEGWNFGPADDDTRSVGWILQRMLETWGAGIWKRSTAPQPHEAHLLRLDCSKARRALGWRPTWGLEMALDRIVEWHRSVDAGEDARAVSQAQLEAYITDFSNTYTDDRHL